MKEEAIFFKKSDEASVEIQKWAKVNGLRVLSITDDRLGVDADGNCIEKQIPDRLMVRFTRN